MDGFKLSEEFNTVRNFLISYPEDVKNVLAMTKRMIGLIEEVKKMEQENEKLKAVIKDKTE